MYADRDDGGGDDDVFAIDICLCHVQLTVCILLMVSHCLF